MRYTCRHTILVCKLSEHISTQLKLQRYLNAYYIQYKWVILACTGYPWEVERQRVSYCKSLGGNAVLVRHNAKKNVFMINFVDESGYVFPHSHKVVWLIITIIRSLYPPPPPPPPFITFIIKAAREHRVYTDLNQTFLTIVCFPKDHRGCCSDEISSWSLRRCADSIRLQMWCKNIAVYCPLWACLCPWLYQDCSQYLSVRSYRMGVTSVVEWINTRTNSIANENCHNIKWENST